MKYIFLIIRHIFPRKRWREVNRLDIVKSSNKAIIGVSVEMVDQFGNRKFQTHYL